jgi:hypothetical protein
MTILEGETFTEKESGMSILAILGVVLIVLIVLAIL